MIYYTDVAKINPVAIGTMFLVTRIWDAINDPIMGMIIDRTKTRWGKCRPYFLWMCIPLGIIMVLTYCVPNVSDTGKLIFAYITFTLLGMIYTAINIPVTAILPRLTSDPYQRTVFGTFRTTGALLGGMVVNVLTLPLIKNLGGGDQVIGYRLTMIIYAVIAAALFLFAFFNTREVVGFERYMETQKKPSLLEGMKAVKGNAPWLIVLIIGIILQLTMAMRGAGTIYYCKYNLGNEAIVPVLGGMMILMLIPLLLLPTLVKKFGKRNIVIFGSILNTIGYIIIWIGDKSISLLIVGNIVGALGLGFGFGLAFVMIADTVDYGDWKNGVRAEGFLSAASSFGQKLGTGLGSATAAWILGLGGYIGGAEIQGEAALAAIKFNYVIAPIIGLIVIIVLMLFYKLDKVMPQMMTDLKARYK
jgi:GPH family glycoside/pentoside/hexuronide:cation symporter